MKKGSARVYLFGISVLFLSIEIFFKSNKGKTIKSHLTYIYQALSRSHNYSGRSKVEGV